MIRNFIFLSYFSCLLIAIVYSNKQKPGNRATAYTVKDKANNEESISQHRDRSPASTYIPSIADIPAEANEANLVDDPESLQTEGYAPTSIKDFKTADPAEGVTLIDAPAANSTGSASLNFNMKLPEGRLGMQPSIPVQYNNEGGSSWLGYGWNMSAPAIGIETRWGAPRYDAAWETEMYTLNGEQLAPVNNRSELIARTPNKRFYQRTEGAFNKIIRHGDNPGNYWWEVTEKNGNSHFYGGRPGTGVVNSAVLKDDLDNIGYWSLVETRDVNGNFVHYIYETVEDVGIAGGTVPGKQLYLSQVLYTGSATTDGPYKIEFIRDRQLGEPKRKDVSIDARLGFKMVSADLLRKVNISFNNTLIRSYEYIYEEGPFYKTLLKRISELDDAGAVFYSHNFDYYDDVNKPAGYNPSAGVTTWSIADDGIKGDIINPIPGFTAEASALSTSKADSRSGGVAVTLGSIFGGTWSKKLSVGGGFNYGEDDQEGLVSMIDINGDGLPDKVFKKGSNLFYRANLGVATHSFGDSRPITGVNDFNTSNSKNIGGGVQVIPYSGFLGYNYTHTTITSKVYFSDFNGDGLMDIASGGRVFFNHLNAQGDPDFVTNSGLTPSPIFTGSIDGSFLEQDTALQAKQERDFPLQDIVRMWEAPFDGIVTVTAPVQLVDVPNPTGIVNAKKDGVRASIQLRDSIRWSTVIGATDFAIYTPDNVSGLAVQKGQHIYFRLQSRYNGEDDIVNWDPVIQYTSAVPPSSDVHFKASNYYKASADFILHSQSTTGMGKIGSISIDGTFTKKITSDSVWVIVTRKRNDTTITLFERVYAALELADGDLLVPGQLPVLAEDELHFLLVSRSYIDRSALQWNPHYAYVAFADNTPVISGNGLPTMQGYPVPDNSNYNHWMIAAPPATVAQQDTVILWPKLTCNNGASGTVWFTIKGTDTIYARRHIQVINGNMSTAMDSIRLIRKVNEPLFMEYATDTFEFAQSLQPVVEVYRDSIFLTAGVPDTIRLSDTVNANLYSNPPQQYLGPLFRGWGHFAFKGDKGDGPLDETKLNLDELNGYPTDPSNYTDSASMGGVQDPSKTNFIMLFPDPQKQLWVGYDTSVFVAGNIMSSSRLWVHDVSVDSLMAGESAGAVYKVSTTETHSFSAGITPGLSASAGSSLATTTVNLDMMDMNGDRYPDVLNDEMIQYTLPNGGLGTTVISQPVGETTSDGWSVGVSLGGSFMEASTENSTKKGAVAAQKTAKNSAGISGSINSNDDESVSSWTDINGDGLVDRIYKDGVVSLNLGYRFAPGEQWGVEGIDRSHSIAAGAGLGVNIDAGSFEAGFGLSRTIGDNSFILNDINGDGLPDQLSMSGTDLVVRLNTGNGFGPAFTWKTFDGIVKNISTGESINAAFTVVVSIPIIFLKICINPTVNIGHGVSKQQNMVMDIDGDGYADMLNSDNDGHLTASVSTIGRTNMLRKVRGPLAGSYFTIDYERIGNTYEMPQSKWVLKNVEVFDGVPGDGIDTTRQQFSYEGGYQDRHEREFYGFSKVITHELNTANSNIVYRSRVQQFLNTTWYNKGLLASEWLEDANGNKFTQTNNLYDIRPLQDHVQYLALVRTEKLFYEGTATADVRTFKQFEYDVLGNVIHISDAGDGSQQDMILTEITYHDIDNLYVKSVPATVTVTTVDGVKRKTVTTVNGTGSILRSRKLLADGTTADTDMEYDSYGNMVKLTHPVNYKNQRLWYSYEYDNTVHSYVTKVTDAFGYTSSSNYDYRFGALTATVSMHNEPMQYTLDNRGRLARLTGPYELAAGKPYTIAFSYNTQAVIPYTITKHYDPEYNSDINTISFADGLGRMVQVKKQVSLFKGKNVADEVKMVVSGSDLFDAFGRVEHSYYPIIEAIGPANIILNTGTGGFTSSTVFDVRDRPLEKVLADGAATRTAYTTINGLFNTTITDALNNLKEIQTDVRDRKRFVNEYGPAGAITTRYDYNALSELLRVVDNNGNVLVTAYDNLGRKRSEKHPDGGFTEYIYDPAGNLLKKITAQIRKEIPNGGAIQYQYDYERLTDIDYPRQYQNKVKYTYGGAGTGSKAGRLILQQDASGGQEFFYGKLGEVIKTIRTVLVSPVFATTYVSEQEYDTWNRIKKMTYADGEEVRYHYNRGGGLYSMEGSKLSSNYKYVDQLGYDEFEQRVYLRYGNGTENKYSYDVLRRRLTQLQAITAAGGEMMNNGYTYDAMSNILGVVNNVQAQNGKLGGYARQDYHYDNLYRLDSASGRYKGSGDSASYGISVSYDNLYNIVHKKMTSTSQGGSYDQLYAYNGPGPHQVTQIGENNYRYDSNGNQLGYGDVENFWDEENRLMGVLNKGVLSQYTYDAGGNRVVKSSGGLQGIWLNGAPAGAVRHSDNYTVYVNPYIVCRRESFTKHYYIENQRIATKLGHGNFTNISFPHPGLTAGGVDYAKRAAQIEKSRIEYYASLGVSPGPPTDKNYWARPENSGIPAPVFIDSTFANTPPGWPGNTTPPPNGPPIFVDTIPSNDSVRAGYGFEDAGHLYESSQHFYHPDHLSSTSYVSNGFGEASQHFEYSPFGETFVEEHNSSYVTPYLFNAKGRDEETGYYYYLTRYYEPVTSQWLSIDPSGEAKENGGYGHIAGSNQQDESSYSITSGNTAVSDVVFGDVGTGMTLSSFATSDGGDEKNKSKKGTANNQNAGSGGSKTTVRARSNARSNTPAQSVQNINKKAFRQGRNAMFFNHVSPRNRSSTKIVPAAPVRKSSR